MYKKGGKITEYPKQIKDKETIINRISSRVFFDRSPITRNAMARLWWLGKLTYDRDSDTPFEITDFIFRNQDFSISIFERSQSRNLEFVKAIYKKLISMETEGIPLTTTVVRELSKYLNAVSGSIMIDSSIDQIDEIVNRYIEHFYKIA